MNCISNAVLLAFPALRGYFVDKPQVLVGISGPVTALGMLVNAPVHMGTGPVVPTAVVRTMFYVLPNDTHYALIFGRTFLHGLEGLIDLKHHHLQYHTAVGHALEPTIPLSQARRQPIYQEVNRRLREAPVSSTLMPSAAPLPEQQAAAPEGAEQYLPPELYALELASEEDAPEDDPLWDSA